MNHRSPLKPALSAALKLAAVFAFASVACVVQAKSCPDAPPVIAQASLERGDGLDPLPIRLSFPQHGKNLPVIVFSHGAYSSKDDYSPILDHWARCGYVVIAMTHRDSVRLGTRRGNSDPRYVSWRIEDVSLTLEQLPRLLDMQVALAGRVERENIAIAGHSFGGLIAQTIAGATLRDPITGIAKSHRHAGVRAALVFSGAGAMPPTLLPADFASLEIPTLVTVGTLDLQQVANLDGYTWRRQPFDYATHGKKYLLVIEGADHYLGGIVGRDDLPQAADAEKFLDAFNSASTLFFDGWLKGDATALQKLDAVPRAAARFAEHATLQQR